jgi:hypothetical protein
MLSLCGFTLCTCVFSPSCCIYDLLYLFCLDKVVYLAGVTTSLVDLQSSQCGWYLVHGAKFPAIVSSARHHMFGVPTAPVPRIDRSHRMNCRYTIPQMHHYIGGVKKNRSYSTPERTADILSCTRVITQATKGCKIDILLYSKCIRWFISIFLIPRRADSTSSSSWTYPIFRLMVVGNVAGRIAVL